MSQQFLVWHQGPDDIHPADTWAGAVSLANRLNGEYEAWCEEHFEHTGSLATVRSWAVPYTLGGYRAETGHLIDFTDERKHDG